MFRIIVFIAILCFASFSNAGMQAPRKLIDAASGGGTWETAWSTTPNSSVTDGSTRGWRNVIGADTSSYDGTSVRVTVKGGPGASDGVIAGMSIGQSTSGSTYDSTPTRITFSGSNGASVPQNTEVVSDSVSFSFDKTKRHIIHIYTTSRNFVTKTGAPSSSLYYIANAIDDTMNLSMSFTPSPTTEWAGIVKLEVLQ